jgi:hypothetical protein
LIGIVVDQVEVGDDGKDNRVDAASDSQAVPTISKAAITALFHQGSNEEQESGDHDLSVGSRWDKSEGLNVSA